MFRSSSRQCVVVATRIAIGVLALAVTGCGGQYAKDGCDAAGQCPGDETATPPSCAGLAATCGANGDESCCASLLVPGGTFRRGYDNGMTPAENISLATLSDFRLDKFEITVGRFRKFAEARRPEPEAGAGKHEHLNGGRGLAGADGAFEQGWNERWTVQSTGLLGGATGSPCDSKYATWTPSPGANEERAINCIDWFQAYAFCIWDGGFLPSEAEWKYAAAGGDEQRTYPWGDATPEPRHASYLSQSGECMADGVADCSVEDFIPVGTKPAGDGKYGQSDLGGTVNEWTSDWTDGQAEYLTPCSDCADLPHGEWSVIYTGGNFYGLASEMLNVLRFSALADSWDDAHGARCARAP